MLTKKTEPPKRTRRRSGRLAAGLAAAAIVMSPFFHQQLQAAPSKPKRPAMGAKKEGQTGRPAAEIPISRLRAEQKMEGGQKMEHLVWFKPLAPALTEQGLRDPGGLGQMDSWDRERFINLGRQFDWLGSGMGTYEFPEAIVQRVVADSAGRAIRLLMLSGKRGFIVGVDAKGGAKWLPVQTNEAVGGDFRFESVPGGAAVVTGRQLFFIDAERAALLGRLFDEYPDGPEPENHVHIINGKRPRFVRVLSDHIKPEHLFFIDPKRVEMAHWDIGAWMDSAGIDSPRKVEIKVRNGLGKRTDGLRVRLPKGGYLELKKAAKMEPQPAEPEQEEEDDDDDISNRSTG